MDTHDSSLSLEAQILHTGLLSITRRISAIIRRSCRSPTITQQLDFATAVLDSETHLVASTLNSPFHLASLYASARALVDYFQFDVREGDVVISSDPYAGGTVLTDLTLLTPVFLDGDLKFFVEVRFRLSDLSGAVAGGFHPWASEIWEEGVRITPIKLVSRGLLQEDILEAILINMRSPTTTRHDIRACVAACRWGVERIIKLTSGYSPGVLENILRTTHNVYEEHIKSLLKSKLGEMSESRDVYLSVGGRERRRVMLRVRMEVREGTVLVDLRGSSPSVDSSVNSTWANTLTMCILPFLMLVLPDVPIHQALLERFELLTEQGSIFDTGRPSATSGSQYSVGSELMTLIMQFLCQEDRIRLRRPPVITMRLPSPQVGEFDIQRLNLANCGEPRILPSQAWGTLGVLSTSPLASVEELESHTPLHVTEREYLKGSPSRTELQGAPGVRVRISNLSDPLMIDIFCGGSLEEEPKSRENTTSRVSLVDTQSGARQEVSWAQLGFLWTQGTDILIQTAEGSSLAH